MANIGIREDHDSLALDRLFGLTSAFNPQIVPILMSFLGIGILIAISVPLSRYVAAQGFRWIAKTPELILVGAIL